MLKCAQCLILALVLTLGAAQQGWAGVRTVPPGDDVAGQSQLFWAQAWWQWALGIPAPNNPLTDTTGANAGVNNKPVVLPRRQSGRRIGANDHSSRWETGLLSGD